MKLSDIRIIYHQEDPSYKFLNKLEDIYRDFLSLKERVIETYAWRVTYKGEKHGRAIGGTRLKPITDKDIIVLLEHMVKYLKKMTKEIKE
jgi:hypothetical protein